MKVKVYYNLHKKCLSVADSKGKVIEHTDSIFLKGAKFRVQPAGRKRVLKEKRKNVHAYVSGERSRMKKGLKLKKTLTYDPYKYDSFVDVIIEFDCGSIIIREIRATKIGSFISVLNSIVFLSYS